MRLLLDIGNTSIQWLLAKGSNAEITTTHALRHDSLWSSALNSISEVLQSQKVDEVVVASVLGEEENTKIKHQLQLVFGKKIIFYETEATRLGFDNSYTNAAKLGVDRWLAILEAWHRHGASVVIDCGSAVTIDVASHEGKHLGGYIVPGYAMLVKALYQGTAKVKVEPEWPVELSLGVSTSQAVKGGCANMCASFINTTLNDVKKRYGSMTVYL